VNLERALLKPMDGNGGGDIKLQDLTCFAMARRLRTDLRKAKSTTGLALFQKLFSFVVIRIDVSSLCIWIGDRNWFKQCNYVVRGI